MKNFFKKHFLTLIFFIFALVEAGYIYYMTLEYKKLYEWEDTNVHKIDSLIDVINNRNDSIEYRIDTITVKVEENKHEFKEEFNNVSNFSIDSNLVFFTEYISEYERRHLDSNHSE